jgi:hypothetical protein
MTTTKTTIRSLAIAATLGLTSACAAASPTELTSPASDASGDETDAQAPDASGDETDAQAPDETEKDHVVLPEQGYRLKLECPRAGELLPC